jgi:hypothetical protein
MTLLDTWQQIDAGVLSVVSLIDGDPPVICTLSAANGKLIFCDLRNWYRVSLEELRDTFTNDERPDSYRGKWVKENGGLPVPTIQVIEDSVSAMFAFVRENDLGNWKPTVASQAMQLYRHRGGPRKRSTKIVTDRKGNLAWKSVEQVWPIVHDKTDILEFERKANYGGQDEAYFVGQVIDSNHEWTNGLVIGNTTGLPFIPGPVHLLDCNSLYPSVMVGYNYPSKLVGYAAECDVEHLRYLCIRYNVIADVLLNAAQRSYPVRHNDRVVYATGQFWARLAGEELLSALTLGEINAVGWHSCYEPMDLFYAYVEELYSLKLRYKQEGNAPFYAIVKLLLNGLYGKFSQRSRRWQTEEYQARHGRWDRWIEYDIDADKAKIWRSVGGVTQWLDDASTSPYGLPAISALVTAAGRERMRQYRAIAGNRNVLYQGTDSLIVTTEGLDALTTGRCVHPTRLGALRHDGTFESAEIRGPQDYTLGCERTTRGLPESAEQTGEYTYTFPVRRRLAGIVATQPGNTVSYTSVTRDYQPIFRYGTVDSDGWVTPIKLENENAM